MINSEGEKDILSSKLGNNRVFRHGHPTEVQTKIPWQRFHMSRYWKKVMTDLQSSTQENK